ncbi:protein kinase [Brevibacillus centrosporus]|uniref:protein kinase domain-containing protein n=1 Tax=Brevibacillus centrosporus TaxID=54910 RepID=UPI003D214AB9
MDVIEDLRVLQNNLKNSEYSFNIDEHYGNVLLLCLDFLSSSGGSAIPSDFPTIDIIENRPVFTLDHTITIPSPHGPKSAPLKNLGGGSYATVWKYKDEYYNRYFAVKKAKKGLSDIELARFKNEFDQMQKLNSPYVVEVFHYDEQKNEYSMECMDQTLDEYISKNNNRLTMNERINLVAQIFKAFTYIHETGILHRDISYSNILIKHYADGSKIVKISDFGLVKTPESKLTKTGTDFKGSLNDPSLFTAGFKNYEERHEIYALAQVINFVISGKKAEVSYKNEKFLSLISKAMSSNLEDRYSSVEEMWIEFNLIKHELN